MWAWQKIIYLFSVSSILLIEKNNKEREETTVKNTLLTNERKNQLKRLGVIAMLVVMMVSCVAMFQTPVAFAGPGGAPGSSSNVSTEALDNVMNIVIDIIGKAALYIGIVIVLWGVFQIVLAFRREDSEGISKQITTVVVGGVLVGFGALANNLYNALVS